MKLQGLSQIIDLPKILWWLVLMTITYVRINKANFHQPRLLIGQTDILPLIESYKQTSLIALVWDYILNLKVDTPLFATNANPLQLCHSPRAKILAFN